MFYRSGDVGEESKFHTEQRAFWRTDERVKSDTGNGWVEEIVDRNVLRKTVRQKMNS